MKEILAEAAGSMGRLLFCSMVLLVLGACAHPISIEPKNVVERPGTPVSDKQVAYVMTDADRNRQVTTEGGGGDKISYYPYKDFERSLRASLRAIYKEVSTVASATDTKAIDDIGASYVFLPEITSNSSSPSMFTWPPTRFSLTVAVDVLDARGTPLAKLRATGTGTAEFDEFKNDFALAGRRAVEDAARALAEEIRRTPKLH